MSKGFLITFLIGLAVVSLAIWGVFTKQAGAHIDPKGSILKVRTIKLDDTTSAAIVDIRLGNDSDYPVIARTIEMKAITAKGEEHGNQVAEMDVKGLYRNYPVLGEQYNPVLKERDKVPPHSKIDREVCAQFMIPVQDLDDRKDMIVSVEDITGPTAEMHEKKR